MVLGLLLIGAVYLWCESKPTNRRILAEKMNEFCFILHSNLPINPFADQEICAGGSLIIHGCNACIYETKVINIHIRSITVLDKPLSAI